MDMDVDSNDQTVWLHFAIVKSEQNLYIDAVRLLERGINVCVNVDRLWAFLFKIELRHFNATREEGEIWSRVREVYTKALETCRSISLRESLVEIVKEDGLIAYEIQCFITDMKKDITENLGIEDARLLTRNLCGGHLQNDPDIWLLRILVEVPDQPMFQQILNVLQLATFSSGEKLWKQVCRICGGNVEQYQVLLNGFINKVSGDFVDENSTACCTFLNAAQQRGIAVARGTYTRIFESMQPCLSFVERCIQLEKNAGQAGDDDGLLIAQELSDYLSERLEDIVEWSLR